MTAQYISHGRLQSNEYSHCVCAVTPWHVLNHTENTIHHCTARTRTFSSMEVSVGILASSEARRIFLHLVNGTVTGNRRSQEVLSAFVVVLVVCWPVPTRLYEVPLPRPLERPQSRFPLRGTYTPRPVTPRRSAGKPGDTIGQMWTNPRGIVGV